MRVPKNQIITNKYTSGGELSYVSDNKEYLGYYHVIMGKKYAGKNENEYETRISLKDYTSNNPLNMIPGGVSSIITNSVKYAISRKFNFFASESKLQNTDIQLRYFAKNITLDYIKITEIDKTEYDKLQLNLIYQTLQLNYKYLDYNYNSAEIDKADKIFIGIKSFLK